MRLDVVNHADDFRFEGGVGTAQHHLAERVLAGEEAGGQRLIDDADAGRALAVVLGERAAGNEGDAQQGEIVLADDREVRERALGQRQDRPSFDAVGKSRVESRQRQPDRHRRVLDHRQRPQPLDDVLEELRLLRRRGVAAGRHADEGRRDASWLEPGRRPLQREKTHQQQAGPDEQHDRERDLAHDQRAAERAAALP